MNGSFDGPGPGPENRPIETGLLAFLASSFLRRGSWGKARSLFGLLHALHPDQARFTLALAYACLKLGRAREALDQLAEAGFGPGRHGNGAGTVSGLLERSKERSKESREENREEGLPAWAFLLAGRALRAEGREKEAREWFGRLHGTERTEA